MKIIRWALRRYWWLVRLSRMARREMRSPVRIPLKSRISAWRHGFHGENVLVYGIGDRPFDDYVSDYQHIFRTTSINGQFNLLLYNKILFESLFRDRKLTPRIFALIGRGKVTPIGDPNCLNHEAILRRVRDEGVLLVKPVDGTFGSNILVIRHVPEQDRFLLNNEDRGKDEALQCLHGRSNDLVCEFASQHPYAAELFPDSSNTVRILTMWDPQENEPFIAMAVQRIGTHKTAPADNWTRGGLSCEIDLETGRLNPGVTFPYESELQWHDVHPETGARITGNRIPNWTAVRDRFLAEIRRYPFLPYVGWDVLITNDGFQIIEGNAASDVNLLQVHRPLLEDARVCSFYEAHGILRGGSKKRSLKSKAAAAG
jgi:hypothetical protein